MNGITAFVGFIGTLVLMLLTAALAGIVISLFPPLWALVPLSLSLIAGLILGYFALMAATFVLGALLQAFPVLTLPAAFLSLAALIGGVVAAAALAPAAAPLLLVAAILLGAYYAAPFLPTVIGFAWAAYGTAATSEADGRSFLIGSNVAATFVGVAIYPLALGVLPLVLGAASSNPLVTGLGGVGLIFGLALAVALIWIANLPMGAPVGAPLKNVVGWATPFLPAAWPVEALGALFFLIDLALHPLSLIPGLGGMAVTVRVRWDTGTIVHQGGLCSDLNLIDTAYDLGTHVLIDTLMGAPPPPRVEPHEVGHHLSLAAFGSWFHMVGWGDEFLGVAYAESIAESNVPPAQQAIPVIGQWA